MVGGPHGERAGTGNRQTKEAERMNTVQIDNRLIGEGQLRYFVYGVPVSYNGSLGIAKRLIEVAVDYAEILGRYGPDCYSTGKTKCRAEFV